MSASQELPAPIAKLDRFLASIGGQLQLIHFSSPMNQVLVATSSAGSVRVVADRGQWFVELAAPAMDEYFDSAVWTACVREVPVRLDIATLDEQVETLEAFLADGSTRTISISELEEARDQRSSGRQALLIDEIKAKKARRPVREAGKYPGSAT